MKRVGLWAIGVGVLLSVGPLAGEQGYAGENKARCTLATLKGLYMFAQSGSIVGLGPQAVTGKDIFYGNGNFDSLATISVNGVISVAPAPGTYTLNSDCTGTVTIPMEPVAPDVHLDIYVAPDGSEFFTIETDTGTVLAGTIQRVAP
jgi:hypothetical protein